jgi:hypothetical protein
MPTLMTPKETAVAIERNLERKTGRPIEQWLSVLQNARKRTEKEAAAWLKEKHGLGHFQAQLVARAAFGRSWTAEYEDSDALLAALYAGKRSGWRAVHDAVMSAAKRLGRDVSVSVCKTYVSAYRKRQFVVVRPKMNGLEVKVRSATERVFLLTSADDVDATLRRALASAYEAAA